MIFDTHAHYDDAQYKDDLPDVMRQMESSVGAVLTCAVDYESSQRCVELAARYPKIYAAVGVFPEEIKRVGEWDEAKLRSLAEHKKVVCIGEIGLDYFWEDNPPREVQIEWAAKQIQLANDLGRPISFHDREAHGDTMDLMRKYKPRGVLHCFSGSVEMAKSLYSQGMHIGIGGVVTFKNARKTVEVVRELPLQAIVLETDAPYLSPEPLRGKRNRSDYISHIAEKIAQIKEISVQEVLEQTTKTANKIFLEGKA